jgi:hypothetical protein
MYHCLSTGTQIQQLYTEIHRPIFSPLSFVKMQIVGSCNHGAVLMSQKNQIFSRWPIFMKLGTNITRLDVPTLWHWRIAQSLNSFLTICNNNMVARRNFEGGPTSAPPILRVLKCFVRNVGNRLLDYSTSWTRRLPYLNRRENSRSYTG